MSAFSRLPALSIIIVLLSALSMWAAVLHKNQTPSDFAV